MACKLNEILVGFGTREALVVTTQVLVQKYLDKQKPAFACIIDYEKAFDKHFVKTIKEYRTLK